MMLKKKPILLAFKALIFTLLFFPNTLHAEQKNQETQYGLAMHGQPKYNADFKHLDYSNPNAPKGGHVKYGVKGSFDNLNHHVITGNAAQGLGLVNDKLMARVWDEPFTLYGLVAKNIEIAKDRSWIIFNLRPEARFHDGKQMTTDDVIFSYESYLKYGHPVRRRVYGLVKNVTKINDQKVKFEFGEGYDPETALILAMMPVLPKHYWTTHDISKTTLKIPLGSGPYKIKTVENGRKITYERVKNYWAKDLAINSGHYNFDNISYLYFRDDGIALEAFKAGEYDIRREHDATKWITGYQHPDVTNGEIIKAEIEHGRPEWVRSFIYNTRRELFKDIKVREALTYAFDFEWINKNLYYGAFKRIESFFPNSILAATGIPEGEELEILKQVSIGEYLPKNVFGPAYKAPLTDGSGPRGFRKNLKKADQLLKEAGWIVVNGKRTHKVSGEVFKFEILLGSPNDEKFTLEFIRALKKLGIEARPRTVDSAQFSGRLDSFDYDMTVYRWVNSLSPGNEQMNYWSSHAANLKGSRNYAGVKNKAIDFIADAIARAPTRKSLEAHVRALDRVLSWGYYTIPLYYLGKDLVAYRAEIKRPKITPLYGIVMETWWQN